MTENALHQLRSVGLDFLDVAPVRFTYEVELPACVEAVFGAISADPSTWTWFPGLADGRYEGAETPGVGTRRAISLEGSIYRETILAWDAPTRWAYRVDESSETTFDALVEDWVMEPRGLVSVLRWTFAVDPQPELKELIAGAGETIGTVFGNAMVSFAEHLAATDV